MTIISTQDPQEREGLFSDTDGTTMNHCLHHLVESVAQTYPDNIALICADETLSFKGLNEKANRLALFLMTREVGRGDLVVVALDRSLDLVIALLAVLKTGAAYVPIDPSFPHIRIKQMVDDASPKIILTRDLVLDSLSTWWELCLTVEGAQGAPQLPCDTSHLSSLFSLHSVSTTQSANILPINIEPTDLAYVIYTSGSTGRPKGVEISHGALSNFLSSMKQEPGCTQADRLLAITTVSFDISILELFLPLVSGATAVIAQTHQVTDANELLLLMKHHAITMMQGTPSTWQLLVDSGWQGIPRLKKILCGGEALPRRLADQLLVCGNTVWNMFGPTEATVWASLWRVRHGEDVIIGNPIANTQLYVLREDLSPATIGTPGELYIGGASLARGYHNNVELTRCRFLDDPFHPGRIYKTGDIACFVTPQKLSILGRADDQVKIRGHRIELGDIETAIIDHPDISKVVVISRDERLVAYCIRKQTVSEAFDIEMGRGVAEWAGAWDHVYGAESEGSNAALNLAGWRSSYDDLPFPPGEMRDWQSSSVRRILSYAPERVVEIGSGTGLMLFSIAPHCKRYHAMDASSKAVEFTRRHLETLPHVTCEHRQAHELKESKESFDTVIINSVAQYFPSIKYLVSVLEWATRAVDAGRIYVGDVRNLNMLDVFHKDLISFHKYSELSSESLASQAAEAVHRDRELVVSPEFFSNLPTMLPRITHVDVILRDGHYDNEMTRYRYDAILYIGQKHDGRLNMPAQELDWQSDSLDLAALRDMLFVARPNTLRINNVPNGRLRSVHNRLKEYSLVESFCDELAWVSPQDLTDLVTQSKLNLSLLPSLSGSVWSFDALIWQEGEYLNLGFKSPESMSETLSRYANVPKIGEAAKPTLDRLLRPWLAERLPPYMEPSFFVELNELPMTLNGKINRKALPDPLESIEITDKPVTKLEHDILAVWSDVLGHDRIDIKDNFFQIGGDSVRVVRVQKLLENLLGRPIHAAKLFQYYTIEALAVYLSNFKDNDLNGPDPIEPSIPIEDSSHLNEDIAIVSMACRLPGGISTPEEFWELLENGGDAITEIPKDRWSADALYDVDTQARGKSYCRQGGFISSVDSFDVSLFGISPQEAQSLDPAQYLMLETCWEGFERAGYTKERLRGSQTGVFIGVSSLPAYQNHIKDLTELDGYAGTGSAGATMSGRISYTFGLEGPTMTIDTACSSSLVTTHMACTVLRQGECNMAISAGVSLMLSPGVFVEFSRLQGMAPDGRCRAFSADAQGTGWSEGSAAVVLKRLSDAKRDNDPILAVLRGSAVNHGGRSATLTTPSITAQKRLIITALARSGLQPEDIDYVEAHGTGTKLGDPIEASALSEVFSNGKVSRRGKPLGVGSAKSNLGHTQAAAGLVGILKVVLAMHYKMLPRTLHVSTPTPAIDWDSVGMELIQEKRPWQFLITRLRRAGVSAFGIGGTNAHVIVEEAPKQSPQSLEPVAPLPRILPFIISANTDASLRQQAEKLRLYLSNGTDQLGDIAYSLATTRTHCRRRLIIKAQNRGDLHDSLASIATSSHLRPNTSKLHESTPPRLAMLFTGQGSQLPGMGKELALHYPVFRKTLEEIAGHFKELEVPLLEVMWAGSEDNSTALLERTDYAQPALFAFEVALYRLWASWDIRPDFLLGHSIGELAVAHVAGVMNLPDACRLVAARGRLMQAVPMCGKMASLEASAADAITAIETLCLDGKVDVAGHNSPFQTVVSGQADAVGMLEAHFKATGRRVKSLNVSHAFHSHHMDDILANFRAVAETVQFRTPSLTVVSSLTGQVVQAGQLESPEHWIQQARNAVLFYEGIQTLASQSVKVFLEVGPQSVLCGMGAASLSPKDIPGDNVSPYIWLSSAHAKKDATTAIHGCLAELHLRQVPIDWRAYFEPFGCKQIQLPTYAFQRDFARAVPRFTTCQSRTAAPRPLTPSMADCHYRQDDDVCHIEEILCIVSFEERSNVLLRKVQEMAASTLGFASVNAVDTEVSLQDLGIDSLAAVRIRDDLVHFTSLSLSTMFVFDHLNLRALAQSILQKLEKEEGDRSSVSPELDSATPVSTGSIGDSSTRMRSNASSLSDPASIRSEESQALPPIVPLHRVLCPALGLDPPATLPDLFPASLSYFTEIPWCSRLMYDSSPTSGLLPGYGQAITFIPQCFNPASSHHDQFIGHSLSYNKSTENGETTISDISKTKTPPIRHMLSLFRPSDSSHLNDPSRYIPLVASLFALGDGTSGYKGILHGGFTATLLDESISIVHEINTALGKTDPVFSTINVTASLNLRFQAPVPTIEAVVCVMAWIEKIGARETVMKAELINSVGEKLATADSVFVAVESKE